MRVSSPALLLARSNDGRACRKASPATSPAFFCTAGELAFFFFFAAKYVATKLGITTDELTSYLNMEKRTYEDFKSQQSIYNFGAKVLRLLKIEKGGKR